MHNRNLKENPYGRDIMEDVLNDLQRSVDIALNAGVSKNKIITDLLTLVKMDKKTSELNISHLDINQLLEAILNNYAN